VSTIVNSRVSSKSCLERTSLRTDFTGWMLDFLGLIITPTKVSRLSLQLGQLSHPATLLREASDWYYLDPFLDDDRRAAQLSETSTQVWPATRS